MSRRSASGAARRPAVLLWALVVFYILSAAQHGAAKATANTPVESVRIVELVAVPARGSGSAGAYTTVADGAADARPPTRGPPASGQLLFQSLPTFPEAEAEALATFTGILRSPSGNSQGGGGGDGSGSFSAADDFIAALLRTTRASLAGNRPALRMVRRPAGGSGSSSSSSKPQAARGDEGAVDGDGGSSDSPAAAEPDSSGDAAAAPAAEEATDTAAAVTAATAPAAPVAEPQQQQQLADPASAVDGQVLVTEAEIIPSMQQFGQVVISSLKMRPMPVQDLTRAAGTDAPVWQDGLKQALEAATALAANVSVTHIHTKMTSILNMGLELAEPPLEHASAAASALANSIKALTGDESVLVGVSFIRLGAAVGSNATAITTSGGSSSSSSSSSAQAPQARNSILALLTLYGVGPPANAVVLAQRMQQACPELFAHEGSINNSSCGQTILEHYEAAVAPAAAPAPAPAAAAALPAAANAEALGLEGRQGEPSRSLLQFSGPAGFGSGRQPLPVGRGNSILASLGVRTGRAHDHSGAGSSAFSSAGAGMQAGAGPTSSSRRSSDVSTSEEDEPGDDEESTDDTTEAPAEAEAVAAPSVAFIRVRQQPEVNIIITHAVGVPAGQQATTIASKLQTLTSSTVLAQLLALSGLSLAQAGKPQVLDMQASANSAGFAANSAMAAAVAAAVAAETAAEHSSKAEQIAAAGGKSGGHVAAWVAAAVAVSVVAVSAAAVAIVIVKQRTKQARARSGSEHDQLPKSSKRRSRSSKGGKPASRYLPSSHAIMLPAMSGGEGGGMPSPPCVIVTTAVGSPSQHQLACCTPLSTGAGLSLLKPRLAVQGSTPLAGTPGSGTRLHGPQTPVHAVAVQGAFNAPPLARGDSVSSAVLADLNEQDAHDSSNCSSDSEEQEGPCQHSGAPVHRAHTLQLADSGSSPCHSCSLAAHNQQQQLPAAADGQHTLRARNSSAAERDSPMQQLKQQWQIHDCSSPASPSHKQLHHHQQQQQQQHVLVHWSSWGLASGAGAASPGAPSAAPGSDPSESLRLFSRPVSESSLPDDLRQVLASAAAAAAAAAAVSAGAGGEPSACSSSSQQAAAMHTDALAQQHQLQQQQVCRHSKLSSCGSGGSPCSGVTVRATPFLAAYDFSCLGDGPTSSAGGVTTPQTGVQQASMVVSSVSALHAAHLQQQLELPSGSASAGGADTPTSQGRPRVSPFMLRDNIPPGVQ